MSHLNYKQVQDLADGSIGEGTDALARHAAAWSRCAREVAFQRSMARAAKEAPVVKTSTRFTRSVMETIDPGSQETWIFRFLGGTGKMLAMVVVLGVVGFALTLLPGSGGTSDQSSLSKLFSDYYTQMEQVLTQETGRMSQTMTSQTATEESKILSMTIFSILVLALLDRFVLRRFLRLRHR